MGLDFVLKAGGGGVYSEGEGAPASPNGVWLARSRVEGGTGGGVAGEKDPVREVWVGGEGAAGEAMAGMNVVGRF